MELSAPSGTHGIRRTVLALAVAAMGVVDLLSAALSHPPDRLRALQHLVPTTVLDTSRTFTLLAGATLLVAAWGLRRGKRRAFVAALFLCALSVPVNLLKALDIEEAIVASALLFFLGVSADAFRVRSRQLTAHAILFAGAWVAVAFGAYAVGGCWLLARKSGANDTFATATAEAAYRVFGIGEPALSWGHTPQARERRMARWFLESLPVVGLTLLTGAALAGLRPLTHRGRHRAARARVRALLREHGDSSVGWFALGDDADYFFSANQRAVIAYRYESETLLAIGDPIGPAEEIEPLLAAFEAHCREADWDFAFFQARRERLEAYARRGWRSLHIGEDPILDPERFTLEGSAMGDVRRATRRLDDSGLEVSYHFPDLNPLKENAENEPVLAELKEISSEWVGSRRGEEKGFCMSRFDPARLDEVWVATAWNASRRRVEAFVTWVPVWARRGWALDLMRRRSDAPAGVTDFLIAHCVAEARARGDRMVSLSLSALAKADPPSEGAPERARQLLIRHLGRFYDFENLFRWKKKFGPEFEERFLVYPAPLALPKVALALVRAQSSGGLRSYLRRAVPRPRSRPRPEAA
ncbi:MAG TPA: phosphatidylglycerol lysyltransferase domain-containing protein [Candidatus Eisenbacteria bacterium]|nr:phosphatidylglycerol lysyltransferase domain-containing protein [Candidatus Eisenbacteria bacterium]